MSIPSKNRTTTSKDRPSKIPEAIEVSVQAHSLLELETILDQLHVAVRAGTLDFGSAILSLEAEFVAVLDSQSFEPLEKLIAAQQRPWGVSIHGRRRAAS